MPLSAMLFFCGACGWSRLEMALDFSTK